MFRILVKFVIAGLVISSLGFIIPAIPTSFSNSIVYFLSKINNLNMLIDTVVFFSVLKFLINYTIGVGVAYLSFWLVKL